MGGGTGGDNIKCSSNSTLSKLHHKAPICTAAAAAVPFSFSHKQISEAVDPSSISAAVVPNQHYQPSTDVSLLMM